MHLVTWSVIEGTAVTGSQLPDADGAFLKIFCADSKGKDRIPVRLDTQIRTRGAILTGTAAGLPPLKNSLLPVLQLDTDPT